MDKNGPIILKCSFQMNSNYTGTTAPRRALVPVKRMFPESVLQFLPHQDCLPSSGRGTVLTCTSRTLECRCRIAQSLGSPERQRAFRPRRLTRSRWRRWTFHARLCAKLFCREPSPAKLLSNGTSTCKNDKIIALRAKGCSSNMYEHND